MLTGKSLFSAIVFSAVFALAQLPAQAAGLDAQLEATAKQFSSDASTRFPDIQPVNIAVFPFQADEKLSKKKVNLAVSELLSQKLIRKSKFRLLERASLDDVLKEQKLGLSGAIESETAAKVGRLAGVKLIVLGSVVQMGKSYQVSAKMVDSDSSEVVSVSMLEVPVAVFDGEAARYLTLVPDTQAISISLLWTKGAGEGKALPDDVGAETVSHLKKTPTMERLGVGLKYFPRPEWQTGLSVYLTELSPGGSPAYVGSPNARLGEGYMDGVSVEISAKRRIKLSERTNLYAGLGVSYYGLSPREEDSKDGDNGWVWCGGLDGRISAWVPAVGVALEWRLQERFGVSLFGTYGLSDNNFTLYKEKNGQRATFWAGTLPRLNAGAEMSLYF